MKLIYFFTAFLFLGCCQGRKDISIDKSILGAEKTIVDTENILKKIPTSEKYKNLKPIFSTNGKNIYLSYGNFDNDFNYRIDTLKSIKFLNDNEFKELKKNIYKLSKIGLGMQDYVIYNPDTWKGIYIYTYKYEDSMSDNPEKIPYISLMQNLDEKDEWFNNTFKKIAYKNPIVLLTKIKG